MFTSSRSHTKVRACIVAAAIASLCLVACAAAAEHRAAPNTDFGSGTSDEDGEILAGAAISPFDEHVPAVGRLSPGLLAAVQAAATDAETQGVEMVVTSGWRSARYQQKLLDDASRTYGSLSEARKWVHTPEGSAHVTGDAVDIGYTDADSWLSQHGARYGLCQIYSNEMWHFELTTDPSGLCPEQKSNAAG